MSLTQERFWKTISWFGGLPGVILLLFITTLPAFTLISNENRALIATLVGWGGVFVSYVLGTIIKYLYYKPRPMSEDTSTVWNKIIASSVYSAHSSNAMICAIIASVSYVYYFQMGSVASTIITVVCFVVAALIGYSRVVLKKHALIDVIYGYLLGCLVVAALTHYSTHIITFVEQLIYTTT